MQYKRYILFLMLLLATSLRAQADHLPVAIKGELDLRGYDFFEQGSFKIEGEWRFFWEDVIDPSSHSDSTGYFVPVPSAWGQLKELVPGIEKTGYASYNLKILLPKNVDRIAFRFTEVFSGSGYYVNGKNIGFTGFPGANSYQNLFDARTSLFTTSVNDSILDLVVHVSNFNFRSGGIKGQVNMGIPMQLMHERSKRQHLDFFLIGAFLIVGIFFLGMFFIHTELYKLFFSLICILFAFRLLLISESGYLGWLSGIAHIRLEYISFSIMVPLFILMIRYLFPNDFPSLLFKIIMWGCTLMVIILIVSPSNLFSKALVFYFIFVSLSSLVILYVIYNTLVRGRLYAVGFAIGVLIVVAGTMNDILIVSDIIETGYKSQYAMFIYVLIYALIFSLKEHHVIRRSAELSAQISEVNENLESIVEERTHELNEKSEELVSNQEELKRRNQELQQLIAVRNRFFTIIGHDIRGPVGYTTQMLEMILSGEIEKNEEVEILKLLVKSSKATMGLLENLLIWGRSQIGNLKSIPTLFKVEEVIEESMGLFSHAIREKSIHVEVNISKSEQIYADIEQIKMVIRNLISNAVKFTRSGGSVLISTKPSEKGNEIELQITDSGIGIPAIMIEKLFSTEEFYTTDGTFKEKGSGLGLKLCKELIDLNGGWIKVESKTGEGSVFTIGLPANASVQN